MSMSTLRQKLAQHGFESNADYDFEINCFLGGGQATQDTIRALNIEGEPGRHKTAFANALARALEYPSVLYFDFSHSLEDEEKKIELELRQMQQSKEFADKEGRFVPPVKPLDKIMTDACAYSESHPTMVIFDQLQLARFRDHIRLYEFICQCLWVYPGASYTANPKLMSLCLISEEPLYHSLQKYSYRLWINRHGMRNATYTTKELAISESAGALVEGLNQLFTDLGVMPTLSEFRLLLADLIRYVRSEAQFAPAIYARVSGLDRQSLYDHRLLQQYKILMPALEQAIDIEHIDEEKGVDERGEEPVGLAQT